MSDTAELDRVVVTRPVMLNQGGNFNLMGLFVMQACAVDDATDEEILHVCNRDNPSGTSRGWVRVIREDSEQYGGPGPCADIPGRTHYLVVC